MGFRVNDDMGGKLEGKVALVTGASSGLGVQFARCLSRAGARVALCARRVDRIEAVASDIHKETGFETVAIPMDVTDLASIESAVASVVSSFGRLDILVRLRFGASDPARHVRVEY